MFSEADLQIYIFVVMLTIIYRYFKVFFCEAQMLANTPDPVIFVVHVMVKLSQRIKLHVKCNSEAGGKLEDIE